MAISKKPAKKAPAKAGAVRKPRLVDRARFGFVFNGELVPHPLVDTLVTLILQWAKMTEFDDPVSRDIAMQRLREVATAATQERLTAMLSATGGGKGGRQLKERDASTGKASKRDLIKAAAADYQGPPSAKLATLARKAGSTQQYVRIVLKETEK